MMMMMMTMGGCSNLWSVGPPWLEGGARQPPPSHPSLREDNHHNADDDDHHDDDPHIPHYWEDNHHNADDEHRDGGHDDDHDHHDDDHDGHDDDHDGHDDHDKQRKSECCCSTLTAPSKPILQKPKLSVVTQTATQQTQKDHVWHLWGLGGGFHNISDQIYSNYTLFPG